MKDRLSALLTVKSLVTVTLTGVFAALALQRCVSAQEFLTVFTVVISFYFGTQQCSMKICLDAGHGTGQNQSPARCGYFEGDRMFTLQRLLQQELEAYGVTVVCTRAARQDDPPLYTRALAAKDCDLFLSLHSNAAGNGVCESVDYPVVFYPVSGKGIGLAAELAECWQLRRQLFLRSTTA